MRLDDRLFMNNHVTLANLEVHEAYKTAKPVVLWMCSARRRSLACSRIIGYKCKGGSEKHFEISEVFF